MKETTWHRLFIVVSLWVCARYRPTYLLIHSITSWRTQISAFRIRQSTHALNIISDFYLRELRYFVFRMEKHFGWRNSLVKQPGHAQFTTANCYVLRSFADVLFCRVTAGSDWISSAQSQRHNVRDRVGISSLRSAESESPAHAFLYRGRSVYL